MLQRRPNTFAQTILSLSFFACDKPADHTYRLARDSGTIRRVRTRWTTAVISNDERRRLAESEGTARQSRLRVC